MSPRALSSAAAAAGRQTSENRVRHSGVWGPAHLVASSSLDFGGRERGQMGHQRVDDDLGSGTCG
jgi:hypothetical protein